MSEVGESGIEIIHGAPELLMSIGRNKNDDGGPSGQSLEQTIYANTVEFQESEEIQKQRDTESLLRLESEVESHEDQGTVVDDEDEDMGDCPEEYYDVDEDENEDEQLNDDRSSQVIEEEGQEATWIEDDVSTVVSVFVKPMKTEIKRKITKNPFRFRRQEPEPEVEEPKKVHVRKTKVRKSILLLSQQDDKDGEAFTIQEQAAANMLKARQMPTQALEDAKTEDGTTSKATANTAFDHATTAGMLLPKPNDDPGLDAILSDLAEKGEKAAFHQHNNKSATGDSQQKTKGSKRTATGYAGKAFHFFESIMQKNAEKDKDIQGSSSCTDGTVSTLGLQTDTFEYQMRPVPSHTQSHNTYHNMELMSITSLNEILDGSDEEGDDKTKAPSPRQMIPTIDVPHRTPKATSRNKKTPLQSQNSDMRNSISLTGSNASASIVKATSSNSLDSKEVLKGEKKWGLLKKLRRGKTARLQMEEFEKPMPSIEEHEEEGLECQSPFGHFGPKPASKGQDPPPCLSEQVVLSASRSSECSIAERRIHSSSSASTSSESGSKPSRYHILQQQGSKESSSSKISKSNENSNGNSSDDEQSQASRRSSSSSRNGSKVREATSIRRLDTVKSDWDQSIDFQKGKIPKRKNSNVVHAPYRSAEQPSTNNAVGTADEEIAMETALRKVPTTDMSEGDTKMTSTTSASFQDASRSSGSTSRSSPEVSAKDRRHTASIASVSSIEEDRTEVSSKVSEAQARPRSRHGDASLGVGIPSRGKDRTEVSSKVSEVESRSPSSHLDASVSTGILSRWKDVRSTQGDTGAVTVAGTEVENAIEVDEPKMEESVAVSIAGESSSPSSDPDGEKDDSTVAATTVTRTQEQYTGSHSGTSCAFSSRSSRATSKASSYLSSSKVSSKYSVSRRSEKSHEKLPIELFRARQYQQGGDEATRAGKDSLIDFIISPRRANIVTPGGTRPYERGDEESSRALVPALQPIDEKQVTTNVADETSDHQKSVENHHGMHAKTRMRLSGKFFGHRKNRGRASISRGSHSRASSEIESKRDEKTFVSFGTALGQAAQKAEEANMEVLTAPFPHRRLRPNKLPGDDRPVPTDLVEAIRMQAGLERKRRVDTATMPRQGGLGDAPGTSMQEDGDHSVVKNLTLRMDPSDEDATSIREQAPTPRKKISVTKSENGAVDDETAKCDESLPARETNSISANDYDQRKILERLYGPIESTDSFIVAQRTKLEVGKGVYIGDLIPSYSGEEPANHTDESTAEKKEYANGKDEFSDAVIEDKENGENGLTSPKAAGGGTTPKLAKGSRRSMLSGFRNMLMSPVNK